MRFHIWVSITLNDIFLSFINENEEQFGNEIFIEDNITINDENKYVEEMEKDWLRRHV